jgi:signal transduction histidine kinase/CheY-like chemotaxis protein
VARFSYRLDDGPWTEARERSVCIAGGNPGRHHLEIRSQVRNGPFSRKQAAVEFDVRPFWFESWWFRGVAAGLTACLIYGIVLWRNRILRQRNTALERAVRDRTAELEAAHANLTQEKLRADSASAAKGQFLAHMSHEIRTPMNGVIGMINLTLDTELNLEQKQCLRTALSSAQALLGVLNDVLDFSKIEAGKLEIVSLPFRVADPVRDCCSLLTAVASEKGIGLVWQIADGVPQWAEGDENRIRQILLNLAGNAIKFTRQGEVRVAVSASELGGSDVDLHFAVRDTGIGIPKEQQKTIFEPFRQADASTSRKYGGTGLGLSICSQLIALMGGGISLESELGAGSTFSFRVRARKVEPVRRPAAVATAFGRAALSLRILMAEDNRVNQMVAKRLLVKRGHSVEMVETGREAVARWAAEPFDLILMDVQMPEMDGWEATRAIRDRESETGVHTPIVGLTAHAMTEARRQCREAGMDDVLIKPFEPASLYDTIENLVERRQGTKRPGACSG